MRIHMRACRLEGWDTAPVLPILRDAALRTAPQDEVSCESSINKSEYWTAASSILANKFRTVDAPQLTLRGVSTPASLRAAAMLQWAYGSRTL
jgi:hypothetical protein